MKKHLCLPTLFFVLLGLAPVVKAQSAGPDYTQMSINARTIPRQDLSRNLREWEGENSLRRRIESSANGQCGSRSGSPFNHAPAANASTTFRPASGTIVPQQLAGQFAKTAQDRQELEQLFTQCLAAYEDLARTNGGEVHDVERATSYFITINYGVLKGAKMSDAQVDGVRQSIRKGLLNDNKFQAMSAREKQKMYEMMAVMGSYALFGYTSAEKKDDAKGQQLFRQLAKENLENLLGPIDKVSFTDNGIEFK